MSHLLLDVGQSKRQASRESRGGETVPGSGWKELQSRIAKGYEYRGGDNVATIKNEPSGDP